MSIKYCDDDFDIILPIYLIYIDFVYQLWGTYWAFVISHFQGSFEIVTALYRLLFESIDEARYDCWLLTVLRPAQEFFTYMETSPLPVKGCKI
jgi:hypothetical protein